MRNEIKNRKFQPAIGTQTLGSPGARRRAPYFEFSCRFVHLVVAQVHHEGGQGLLSLLPDVCVSVLQAGEQLRDTHHQVTGDRPEGGQLLCQPAQHLRMKSELESDLHHHLNRQEERRNRKHLLAEEGILPPQLLREIFSFQPVLHPSLLHPHLQGCQGSRPQVRLQTDQNGYNSRLDVNLCSSGRTQGIS